MPVNVTTNKRLERRNDPCKHFVTGTCEFNLPYRTVCVWRIFGWFVVLTPWNVDTDNKEKDQEFPWWIVHRWKEKDADKDDSQRIFSWIEEGRHRWKTQICHLRAHTFWHPSGRPNDRRLNKLVFTQSTRYSALHKWLQSENNGGQDMFSE